jgi:hypothetical protein
MCHYIHFIKCHIKGGNCLVDLNFQYFDIEVSRQSINEFRKQPNNTKKKFNCHF